MNWGSLKKRKNAVKIDFASHCIERPMNPSINKGRNRSINLAEVDFFPVCLRLPRTTGKFVGRRPDVAVRCETRVWAGHVEDMVARWL